VPVSALELVTAPNLHRMTKGFSGAPGLIARCTLVQYDKGAVKLRASNHLSLGISSLGIVQSRSYLPIGLLSSLTFLHAPNI